MIIKYKPHTIAHPTPSMLGRSYRVYPLLSVTIIGPHGTQVADGKLDTGADETVFPVTVASRIGIDLTNAPTGSYSSVGQSAGTLQFAEVTLRIANGGERREWRAWVGFTPVPIVQPLLGFGGFLQFFTATFRGDREEVELTVNSLYPGT